mgnify:CR=1 FL=1
MGFKQKLTRFSGILLIIVGIINMLARIDITIDALVTILLIIGGAASLENYKERHEFAMICSAIGIIYPFVKMIVFYYLFPSIINISGIELARITSYFLAPMVLLSLVVLYLQYELPPKKFPRY